MKFCAPVQLRVLFQVQDLRLVGSGGGKSIGQTQSRQAGLLFLAQTVTGSADVEDMAVVQHPIQDGRGHYGVAQRQPFCSVPVASIKK